jgi:CarD family transcriptional regulator, regulator of rRNA transcription
VQPRAGTRPSCVSAFAFRARHSLDDGCGSYPHRVKLAVGDAVVYAAHGVGRVAAREQRTVLGVAQDVVVLELATGLRVTLPIHRARERLRPVVSEADVRRVQQRLHEDGESSGAGWRTRLRQGQAKLVSGDPLDLAEVVRDGMRCEGGAGSTSKLSESERRLYVQARQLLAEEIGSARGLGQPEADAWIEAQVAERVARLTPAEQIGKKS